MPATTWTTLDDTLLNSRNEYAKKHRESRKAEIEYKKLLITGEKEKAALQLETVKKVHEEEMKLLQDKLAEESKAKEKIRLENEKKQAQWEATKGQNFSKAVGEYILNAADKLQSNLDKTMSSWIEKQESIAYNLNGTLSTATSVSKNLTNALSGTGIVKQQEVYEKLSALVESGIVNNVERRAYLATIAEDLGMAFDVTNKSLNRLIRLQSNDLSDNIMAIESNLKTFLNQNYQTSEYIKDGFYDVSSSLFEAQSLMSSSSAMALEEVIQQWMGSLYSVGMSSSTISAISEAIGALGSGNIGALSGSDIGRLLNMGASVAGLSYSDILNNGLSQDSANKLMTGVVNYLADINANSSNVVKSSLAEVFGVSVSDIVAAANLNTSPTSSGIISDSIGTLLSKTDDYIYSTQKIENMLDNIMYSWGTGIASSPTDYMIYKVVDTIGDITATYLKGAYPGAFGSFLNVSDIVGNAGLIAAMGLGLKNGLNSGSIGSFFSNISTLWKGNGATSIYNALSGESDNIKVAGNLFGGLTTGISSSAVASSKYGVNLDSEAAANAAVTSATASTKSITADEVEAEEQWKEDVRTSLSTLLDEVKLIPTTAFNTYTRISEAENTVTIGNDMTSVYDIIADSAASLRNIYALLSAYFTSAGGGSAVATGDVLTSGEGLMTNGYNILTNSTTLR